jgi:GNAT superfamily N-acetyltransferase
MRIQLLSEARQHLPKITRWLHDDWRALPPWADLEQVRQSFESRCSERPFPKCFVAVSDNDELLATASLKLNELANHPDKTHWLGEVYVKAELRGKGLGSLLTSTATDYAFAHGVDQLFLYTPDQQALYAKLGWRIIGSEQVNKENVILMMRASQHLR